MESVARALGTLLEWILIALMVALTAIVVVAVVYRKLDASLSWYDEVASIVLAWITYYGGALAVLRRKHIGFDSVLLAIPMPARLVVAWIAEIVFLAFFVLLAWAGWTVLQVLEGMTLISLTWVPVRLTQSVIPIGAVLFILCELLSLPAYLAMLRRGVSAEHAEIEAEIAAETRLAQTRLAAAGESAIGGIPPPGVGAASDRAGPSEDPDAGVGPDAGASGGTGSGTASSRSGAAGEGSKDARGGRP